MTEETFYSELEKLGIPVAYEHASIGTKVPFMTYTWVTVPEAYADDIVYVKKAEVEVVLVADTKTKINDYAWKLEDIFETLKLGWSADESYDSSDKIYLRYYTLEV